MTAITRRAALAGAGAAVAVAGMPGAAQSEDAALLALEQQWLAQRDYIHNYPDDSDAALQPLYDRQDAFEREIMATPARSFAGIAVKLRLATYYVKLFASPEGYDWDQRLTFHVLSDVERLTGGAVS